MDLAERLRTALAGRYEVGRELGRGGMAAVFLAEDLRLRRQVAIKVLSPELASVLGDERFLREIEIAARLQHAHILPLHDSGSAGGLLFYVMPFVEGESLRDRLRRERQLAIEDAIQIAQEVAGALSYAHSRDVVHRDIKPDNILLSGGHAMVADFGIARAISRAASEEQLTRTGITLGTPAYMSPEQAGGDNVLDGRSDIYSLGCVLYEMLAGEPPFGGSTAQAILSRHLLDPVPPLRTVRKTVPEGVEAALLRALEKVPADRYATAGAFVTALAPGERAEHGQDGRPHPVWPVVGAGIAVAVVVVGILAVAKGAVAGRGAPADTSQYAVLPFESAPGIGSTLEQTQRMWDALGRWTGLVVVDQSRVAEEVGARGGAELSPRDAARIARRLGAGRYIRGSVSRVGDSVRVHATLYDQMADGTPLSDHGVRMSVNLEGADSGFAELADHLLLRGIRPGLVGTRSLPARQAFERGQTALSAWNLARADSDFSLASTLDPRYAEAHLWVALVRAWAGAEAGSWRVPAEQAALGRDGLPEPARSMSQAVLHQARGDLARACPSWHRLTEAWPRSFAASYSSALCQVRDSTVVRDRASRSGWSFRTSYYSGLLAFQRAFALQPSVLASFQDRSYESLRNYFLTSGNTRRGGTAQPPDTRRFAADPSWQGDTLAFIPYPRHAPQLAVPPATSEQVVRLQREMFRDVALAWVATSPASGRAFEALSVSLALLGDPSALDTLKHARVLASDALDRTRLAVAHVWALVAFAVPWDEAGLRYARALADSLLEARRFVPADPLELAGLSALTGRAARAAVHARSPAAAQAIRTPVTLWETAPALLVFAAFGGPKDSLVGLEGEVRTAIEQTLLPPQREAAVWEWVARPATLAFPDHEFVALRQLAGQGDYLLDLQATWAAGDSGGARQGLRRARDARRHLLPASLTLDGLYPEAAVLFALGDLQDAASWLDPTLRALPQVAPHVLAAPVVSASLVRALALRARIANRLGDGAGARTWARAVVTLWSDADRFLQPVVSEMRQLAR